MIKILRFYLGKFWLILSMLTFIGFPLLQNLLFSNFAMLSEVKNHSKDDQRDIYNTFDSETQKDQGLPVDPFDLMNRLKQVGKMNDATSPSDAIDDALNAFIESENENVPIE